MEKYSYTNGFFVNTGNQNWEEWQNNTLAFNFRESKRDNDWITLRDENRKIWVLLPLKGGMCYYARGGASDWTELYDVTKEIAESTTKKKKDPTNDEGSKSDNLALRSAIIKQLEYWDGAIEGDNARFDKEFISPAGIESARKAAGKQGWVHTTCIDFQTRVLSLAAHETFGDEKSKNISKVVGTRAKEKALELGAWVDASVNMEGRPKHGDIFILVKKENGWFSHIGFIKSIQLNADGTETWITVDGGQGLAGRYSKDGVLLQKGKEILTSVTRIYTPHDNTIAGESNQDNRRRLLQGWIDVDKLVP